MDTVKSAQIILSGAYERRRGYLFAALTVMNQLVVTVTLGIWAAILRLDHSTDQQIATQVGWAGALASLLIGLWRYYAHFLDHGIVRLYPALYLSERAILPPQVCLLNPPQNVPPLTLEDIERGIRFQDVREKDFGSRGHIAVDTISAALIVLFGTASAMLGDAAQTVTITFGGTPHVIGYLLLCNLIGLVLVVVSHFRWQNAKHQWPVPNSAVES